jgi:hypothetical protein
MVSKPAGLDNCWLLLTAHKPSATGQDWEKYSKKFADDEVEEKKITPLTDEYGLSPVGTFAWSWQETDPKLGISKSSRHTAPPHMRQPSQNSRNRSRRSNRV